MANYKAVPKTKLTEPKDENYRKVSREKNAVTEEKCKNISFTLPLSELDDLEKLVGQCIVEFVNKSGGRRTEVTRSTLIRAAIDILKKLPDDKLYMIVQKVKKPKEGKR